MSNIRVRSFTCFLFALSASALIVQSIAIPYPCPFYYPKLSLFQKKLMTKPFMTMHKPTPPTYPYYYQPSVASGFQVPTVGYLSPYYNLFQRPPLPVLILVTKLPDQSSSSNAQAVQLLPPTSEPSSNSAAGPDIAVKPADTASSTTTSQTSNPTPQSTTPITPPPQSTTPTTPPPQSTTPTTPQQSTTPTNSPQQATTSSPTVSPQSPPVNSNTSPTTTSPIKPSAPTSLPNYKPPDATTPNTQRSLDLRSWKESWQENVYTSTGSRLCQTTDIAGTKQTNDKCNSVCEKFFNIKVDQIGLTETGIRLLGGSCDWLFQNLNNDVCTCNFRMGREIGHFLVINKK